jgi:hypothetical protein
MPPRRSARVAAIAQQHACLILALPLPVTERVLMFLPVDARGRAACVCKAWRAALCGPMCWRNLDLTRLEEPLRTAVACQKFNHPVVRAAVARACGQLHSLDVSPSYSVARADLVEFLTANAGLRELRLRWLLVDDVMGGNLHQPSLQALMAAAPLLQTVKTTDTVSCKWQSAPAVLHAAPPLAQLSVCKLFVHFQERGEDALAGMARVGPFTAALADGALQPALTEVSFQCTDVAAPGVMDAIVDAALARRLPELSFVGCAPPPAAPLARLLRGASFTKLILCQTHGVQPLFDAAGAALVADALHVTTALTELTFMNSGLCHDAGAAQVLLGALVGHPSLRELALECERGLAPALRGAALAAILFADTPALQSLSVYCAKGRNEACACRLGDAGLMPLMAALRHNHHLRQLSIGTNNMSTRFARQQLLPAVRLNTSLRDLWCDGDAPGEEAMELVEHRRSWSDTPRRC